jgi:hypothetical protein
MNAICEGNVFAFDIQHVGTFGRFVDAQISLQFADSNCLTQAIRERKSMLF